MPERRPAFRIRSGSHEAPQAATWGAHLNPAVSRTRPDVQYQVRRLLRIELIFERSDRGGTVSLHPLIPDGSTGRPAADLIRGACPERALPPVSGRIDARICVPVGEGAAPSNAVARQDLERGTRPSLRRGTSCASSWMPSPRARPGPAAAPLRRDHPPLRGAHCRAWPMRWALLADLA